MQQTVHMKCWGSVSIYYDETDASVKLGSNANIAPTVLFRRSLIVGTGTFIDDYCYFTCNMHVGNYVHIAPYVYACGGEGTIHIGDYSGLSAGCKFLCASDNYLFGGLQHPAIPKSLRDTDNVIKEDVVIGRGCLFGVNTVCTPGVIVPDGVATGPNVVLTKHTRLKPWHYYPSSVEDSAVPRFCDRAPEYVKLSPEDVRKINNE